MTSKGIRLNSETMSCDTEIKLEKEIVARWQRLENKHGGYKNDATWTVALNLLNVAEYIDLAVKENTYSEVVAALKAKETPEWHAHGTKWDNEELDKDQLNQVVAEIKPLPALQQLGYQTHVEYFDATMAAYFPALYGAAKK